MYRFSVVAGRRTNVSRPGSAFSPCQSVLKTTGEALSHSAAAGKGPRPGLLRSGAATAHSGLILQSSPSAREYNRESRHTWIWHAGEHACFVHGSGQSERWAAFPVLASKGIPMNSAYIVSAVRTPI